MVPRGRPCRCHADLEKELKNVVHVPTSPCLFENTRGYNARFIVVNRPRTVTESRTWMCLICGWIYDEAAGDPDHGIPPGTAWANVPMNWTCPECGARKEDFEMVQI